MNDPRLARYAELLIDTCLGGVVPRAQVLVVSGEPARPLLDAVGAHLAARGAYAIPYADADSRLGWLRTASIDLVGALPALEEAAFATCDALIQIEAPANSRALSAVSGDRIQALQGAYQPAWDRILRDEVPWVLCQYPTPALAQDAGLSTEAFADILYDACLRDWDAEHARIERYAAPFRDAREVRIVGPATDLRLSIDGRSPEVDAGSSNMPGGEFFLSPIEDSANGVVSFGEFPAVHLGRELHGITLRFEDGVVVDASATTEEAFLIETLDTDAGARRLGEFGVGCNPGITRYMRNGLFDEKIDGTIHLAVGMGYPETGGTNESAVHWDIVKDLRSGGRIELDGRVVQENGSWRI